MRRKPTGGSYPNNNQHRRPQRFQQNGGGDRPQGGQRHGGPRRNYGAAREKYLNQAREALAAGDRVLAENYFQHADHCYRMMVEEGSLRPNYTPPPQNADGSENAEAAGNSDGSATGGQPEEFQQETHTISHLPAFITATHGHGSQEENPSEPPAVQNWEERDA